MRFHGWRGWVGGLPFHPEISRIHGFEIHEQPWLPETFRNALTEWLRVLWEYSRAEVVIAPLLETTIVRSDSKRIVDLCSGSSGPVIRVQAELARRGLQIPVILTDKFPDRAAFSALSVNSGGGVAAYLDSVDATSVPERFTGLRPLFNSFHHFRPAEAQAILNAACAARQPIAIFEITERTVPKVLLCFPASFLSCFLLIWRMRPRCPVWWICTWLLPIIPFIVGWDALISHLRSYTRCELRALTEGLPEGQDNERWSWRDGHLAAPRGGVEISFLIGTPVCVPAPPSR
jgi:hypothetical protein